MVFPEKNCTPFSSNFGVPPGIPMNFTLLSRGLWIFFLEKINDPPNIIMPQKINNFNHFFQDFQVNNFI